MSPSAARPAVTLARMLPAARESTSLLSAPTAAAKLVFPSSRRPIVRSTAASASQRCARTADLTCKPEPASRWGAGFSRFPVRESWTALVCGKVGFAEQKAGLAFFRAVWYALPVKIANNWILRHHSAFFPPYRAVKHKRESSRFPSRRKQQWTERNRSPP